MKSDNHNRGWPLQILGSFEQPSSKLSVPIAVFGTVFFVALLIIGFLAVAWLLADLLSGDQKRAAEATKAALPVLAGVVGLPLIIWRLLILDRQTRISEDKTQIDRETHYTSIFSRSIDQLGQTRELKRNSTTDDGDTVESTQTVPNVEVRLGGIHSLARLAEESSRDREKIQNMLRSYIRENSWSDRAGHVTEKLSWPRFNWNWAYTLSFDPRNADALEQKRKWISELDAKIKSVSTWAQPLPETRVDVNEATDALEVQKSQATLTSKPVLYECLFVDRHFNGQFLAKIQFRRCTFVRCNFDAQDQSITISNSFLIGCSITGENSIIDIYNSLLGAIAFRKTSGGAIKLRSCQTYSVHFEGPLDNLEMPASLLYKFSFAGNHQPIVTSTIDMPGCLLLQGSFRNLKFSAASNLNVAAIIETTSKNVDLSEVTDFTAEDVQALKADNKTIEPKGMARPKAWPAYNPATIDDDDIPF
ncbi:hypothetical protein [Bradyrhizobium centrosematis]|uniref:hypothetical protein n=1 Tax=Bradyrhizobium centrosematis TaxID=1300039 RepID=UPI00388DD0F4